MADFNFVVKHGLVVNTNLIANGSQIALGTINSTSNGVLINTTSINIGNASINSIVNSTSFSGTSANATNLNSQPGSYYTNASNLGTGTVPYARIPANIVNTTAAFTLSGITTFNANISLGSAVNILANGAGGTAGQVLLSGGSTGNVYWGTGTSGSNTQIQYNDSGVANASANFTFNKSNNTVTFGSSPTYTYANSTTFAFVNATVTSTINATSYTGTANSSTYAFGKTSETALNANSALTANNSAYLGGTIASSYALKADTHYIGTTAIALNRASASQSLTGITSIDGNANNISAYTINQNLGTGNSPTFGGLTLTGDISTYRSATPSTGVIYLGNSGARYLYYDGSTYTLSGAQLYINGSLALHTANYNSYAPNLTGTGASGTWGINITGNAATAYGKAEAALSVSYAATTGAASSATTATYLSTTAQTNQANFQASQGVGTMLTSTGSLGGIMIQNGGGANAAFMSFHRTGNFAAYFGIDTDNQFAVGGWSSGAGLSLLKCSGLGVGTASAGAGSIVSTGDIIGYYSDSRLKDFEGTIPNALDKVLSLNGYYFRENAKAKELGYDNDARQVGVSAQEVEAVLPEVIADAPINGNFEGADYKTVKYEKLVPLLIEAIKELSNQVQELKTKYEKE
jgi:hypothetical protein